MRDGVGMEAGPAETARGGDAVRRGSGRLASPGLGRWPMARAPGRMRSAPRGAGPAAPLGDRLASQLPISDGLAAGYPPDPRLAVALRTQRLLGLACAWQLPAGKTRSAAQGRPYPARGRNFPMPSRASLHAYQHLPIGRRRHRPDHRAIAKPNDAVPKCFNARSSPMVSHARPPHPEYVLRSARNHLPRRTDTPWKHSAPKSATSGKRL